MSNPQKKQYVLDTNVLLSDPMSLFHFDEHIVAIPMVVLEELDKVKDKLQKAHVQREARMVIGFIDSIVNGFTSEELRTGVKINAHPGTIHSHGITSEGVMRFITPQYKTNSFLEDNSLENSPDNKILSVVNDLSLENAAIETILVTKDVNLRLKAQMLGLKVEDYRNEQEISDADMLSPGYIELPCEMDELLVGATESRVEQGSSLTTVPRAAFIKQLKEVRPDLLIELHNNISIIDSQNRVYRVHIDSDHVQLSPVAVSALMTEPVQGIKAKDVYQAIAMQALLDPKLSMVTLSGPAGSGKTLIALACSIELSSQRQYDRIIITRNTVDMGEEIGFLPGTEQEKMEPWMGAIEDALEVLYGGDGPDKSDYAKSGHIGKLDNNQARKVTAQMLMMQKNIQFKSLTFMRGRSLQRTLLILDEVQNINKHQLKSMCSRMGEGSKIVCLGNLGQIDNRYNTILSNGLVTAVEGYKDFDGALSITLNGGQRSDLATYTEEHID